jgi:hypothetical protein
MAKLWEISSDELQGWASHFDASAIFPKLVRRLLFATTPLNGIDMRADGGTRYEGWDGIVGTALRTTFCPAGLSVWELSVEKKVRPKLDDDYEKRSRKPPAGVQPKLTTYVAVTSRGFSRKAEWIAEKRADGIWADVRVYDADDLATWLEQAPAVARWYANLHGRPAYDGKDVEAFLEEWRKRTSPPLPHKLVLAGEARKAQSDQVLAWLGAPAGRPLLVRGRSREEALLFATATLARQPGAEARLSRSLVVETEDAWRWALRVQGAESLVVLPDFDEPDVGQAAAAHAHVILSSDLATPGQPGSTITLDDQAYPQLAKVIESAGWTAQEAERLIDRAGGDLAALQRMCGYFELPSWAKDSARTEILALLLAGAWVPTFDGDREVLRRLGGDPSVVEQLCSDLQSRRVVKRVAEYGSRIILSWNAPEDAWAHLSRGLTDGHLNRFRDVVRDVLGAEDPAYDLPKEERFMASVKGKALLHSESIRQGLAETIAYLSLQDAILEETLRITHRGSGLAEGLVTWLLRPEAGWIAWASLSKLLPILAEAAPKGFLDRVQASLDQGENGVARLFLEEGSLFGRAPHTGLLWGLEVLAWNPEKSVRSRVIRALTQLDSVYPHGHRGQVDNQPLRSLDTLLRYALPKSDTTVEERIDLMRQVLRDNPPTGRALALGMLRDLRGAVLFHQGTNPRFHDTWRPKNETTEINMAGVSAQALAALADLVTDAGTDADRWVSLLAAVLRGPSDVEEHVLNALARQHEQIQDSTGKLWSLLRKELDRINENDTDSTRATHLRSLYKAFTPNDFASSHAWIFDPFARIPGRRRSAAFQGKDPSLAEVVMQLRMDALKELWDQDQHWEALKDLVHEVNKIDHGIGALGSALGKTEFATVLEEKILADTTEESFISLVPSFAVARTQQLGLPWLENLLRRLLNHDRIDEAVGISTRHIAGSVFWALLDQIGDPLLTKYWEAPSLMFGELSPEEIRYAVDHLLAAGREHSALEIAATQRDKVTGTLAFDVLARLKSASSSAGGQLLQSNQMTPHYVEWTFDIIDRDPPVGKDPIQDIAPLELFFLPILSEASRPARYVSLAFGETPDLFVSLMERMYFREGEDRPANSDNSREQTAQEAATLLTNWNGYPGEGLAESDRDTKLEVWAAEVLRKTREGERGRVGSVHVAEVLARVPRGSDEFWPCLAARRLLETGLYPELGDNLSLAKRNSRGVVGRAIGEGGVQEREIAERYREAARQLEITYPRTAAMLDGIARSYEAEADQEDAEARQARIEHGEQPEEDAPPTPREMATPGLREFVSRIVTTCVGPAPLLEVPFQPRLNLLIGDNSLGKTFILEVLWWALTGAWSDPRLPARPPTRSRNGRIVSTASIRAEAGGHSLVGEYNQTKMLWSKKGTRSLAPGLTIYAKSDGSVSVWDPIRNAKPTDTSEQHA